MKTLRFAFLGVLFVTAPLLASRDNPTPEEIQKIIERFAAKEAEFSQARQNYIYRQSLRFHEMEPGGAVVGKWEEVWDVLFNADGKRTERVVRAPVQSLKNILLEPEDLQDLRSVQPFVLTTKDLPKYNVHYLGKETLDEIPCFVFVVKPKTMEKGERYFSGIVWVDDRDLQIVKTYGRGVGIKRSKGSQYPKFETYRQQVDGKYWFPTYTVSNSTLMFEQPIPIRMTVRYDDYKQFKAESTITFTDSNIVFEDDAKKPDEKKPEQKKQ
ncbi:MAG: hypothetical protein SFV54_01155 [Bryobacteraceae bacterium]|nr:hypothetical protein [Bryobacteraceae bacterium]